MSDRRGAAQTSLVFPPRGGRGGALFLSAQSEEPCGVEVFTRTLVAALNADGSAGGCELMPVTSRWRDVPAVLRRMAGADSVVFGVPLIAWKRNLLIPLVLLAAARLKRRRVLMFLHEWTALHWLRRLVLAPHVLCSNAVLVLSPYIRKQIASDPLIRRAAGRCHLVPHPPTVRRPRGRADSDVVRRVENAAAQFDVVLGYFGSVYRGKAPDVLLDVCAHLRGRGVRALVVFIGSFTKSLDRYAAEFVAKVDRLALRDQVIVTGYVASEEELFALFERIGAFLFLFPEGMTARRSSVIACLQSDRPVVVSAPRADDEFAHHPGLAALIGAGALTFIPPEAAIADIADTLVAAAARRTRVEIDADAWWRATTTAVRAVL